MGTLLEVRNLETSFFIHLGEVKAVRNISFEMEQGDILGIVGESGSGKSVTAYSIMRLVDYPGRIKKGEIIFNGENLLKKSEAQMTEIRGKEIAMIFQDPMTSLNPVFSIKSQMTEVIRKHQKTTISQATQKAQEMLRMVGIPSPSERMKSYPHEFSGGMRQRVMIANALSCNPKLLIADEPTTALDVTIQAQILELMKELKSRINMGIMLITHDLGVIAETCHKVLVMYGGKIMERGAAEDIFHDPQNPYTIGLMKSIPRMDREQKDRLIPIKGSPPDLLRPPGGCPFSPRCEYAMNICLRENPGEYSVSQGHTSSCWLLDKDAPSVKGIKKGGL